MPKHRTIALVTGEAGAGSTRFALTGPGPHLHQSFDMGLEGTIDQAEAEGLLSDPFDAREYSWKPGPGGTFDKKLAEDVRDQFEADMVEALEGGYRMISWDKEDQVWELYRYAEFGAPNDNPKNYAKLNQRYVALVNMVKNYDASLIMIDSLRTPWEKGPNGLVKTKRRERRGFDELDRLVMVEIHMRREPSSDPNASPLPEYYFDIGKCRQNSKIQDQTFAAMTFPEFGTLLMPGSVEEDWK